MTWECLVGYCTAFLGNLDHSGRGQLTPGALHRFFLTRSTTESSAPPRSTSDTKGLNGFSIPAFPRKGLFPVRSGVGRSPRPGLTMVGTLSQAEFPTGDPDFYFFFESPPLLSMIYFRFCSTPPRRRLL